MGGKSELHKEYVLELENELREFEKKEEASTKRMQMLVYPAMVAFIILAAYGFYLIQSLTVDVHRMADSIITISNSVEKDMAVISDTTVRMSNQMEKLVVTTGAMTGKMAALVDTTGDMSNNVGSMTNSIGSMQSATDSMAFSTNNMQKDIWSLNQNVSTPLSMFNKFIPWNNNSNGRFPGSIGPGAVRYYPQYQAAPQVMPQTQTVPAPSGTPTM
jgi:uncharacterized protein YoxC